MAVPNNRSVTSDQPRVARISLLPNVNPSSSDIDTDFSEILEAIADGVIVRNAERQLLYANEAATRLFGYPSIADFMVTTNEEFDSRFDFADEFGRKV